MKKKTTKLTNIFFSTWEFNLRKSMLYFLEFLLYYETDDGVVLDFIWYCILNFGIFTRTGVLLAYNALDISAEMIKCFGLCRKQMLEYFEEELASSTDPADGPVQIAGETTNIDDLINDTKENEEETSIDSLSMD